MTDTLSSPPLDAGLDLWTRTATLPVPTEVRGSRETLVAYAGGGVGSRLRSVSLSTHKDLPTQTGTISVYARSEPAPAVDAFFGATLNNTIPARPRTFLGTISGDSTINLTPDLLGKGDFIVELEGPDLDSGEPGAAPTLTAFSAVGDTYGLRISAPSLPLGANGTVVPVPTGETINVTVDNISLKIENVTVPGTVSLDKKPYAAGTNVHVIGGFAADIDINAVYDGPVTLSVVIPADSIPGGQPENIKISQHDARNQFIMHPVTVTPVPPSSVRLETTFTSASDFALLIRPDGSPVPDFDSQAPASALAFQGHSFASGGTVFVSKNTGMALTASDDFSGVEQRLYLVDPPPALSANPATEAQFVEYGSAFTLAEGTRTLAWAASDRARNFETLQSMPLSVDGTPPATTLAITGPAVVEPARTIVGPNTTLSLSAVDPVSNGVSAGVVAVAMLLDQTPASCGLSLDSPPNVIPGATQGSCGNPLYSEPFAIPAGAHTLGYFGLDNVLNAGVLTSTAVVGDYEPPSFSALEAATLGNPFAASVVLDSTTVSARITVTDALAGVQDSQTPPNLLGFYRFEGDFKDSSGLGHDLTAQGGALTSTDEKRFGQAAYFNDGTPGRRGYLDSLPGYPGGNASVTLSVWAFLRDTPEAYGRGVIAIGDPAAGMRLYVRFSDPSWVGVNYQQTCSGTQRQFIVTADDGPIDRWVCAANPIETNRWYHYAVAYDAAALELRIYMNGALERVVPMPNGLALGRQLQVGGDLHGDNWINGYIDDARVFGRALNGDEIRRLHSDAAVARLSTDGGATFQEVEANLSGGVATASLALVHSLGPSDPRNLVSFAAQDRVGNSGASTSTLIVNLNPTRPPLLVAPEDLGGLLEASPTFVWALDAAIPLAAIKNFRLQVARDMAFTDMLADLLPMTTSAALASSPGEGRFYWRVAAQDNFDQWSPWSSTRLLAHDGILWATVHGLN
ncbi:MAG: LamG domain-containing protein [Elusimicrobia bacterium]|nr:LamG domain-containing protein [Elusimicrobiota bacterium]